MARRLSIVLVSAFAVLVACRDGGGRDEASAAADEHAGPAGHLHDLRPRHGGTVAILGTMLVELVATPDGKIQAHLSDKERRPVPPTGVTGAVTLNLATGERTVALAPADDLLEGRTAPLDVESVTAHLAVTRDGSTFGTDVLLDFTGKRAGVAGVPAGGCVPPARAAETGRTPRCAATFSSAFTALGATPDGSRVVLSLSHGSTSVWSLPAATVAMGLDAAPPKAMLAGQHEPDPRAFAFRPDGTAIAVALGDRLLVFDARSGRFARELRTPGGSVTAVAWLPGGTQLVIATAGDGKARLVDGETGDVLRVLAIDGQAHLAAASANGRLAIATDAGTIALVGDAGAASPRMLTPSLQPIAGIAFADEWLVSAGADGTFRVVDAAGAAETARVDVGAPLVLLAIAPDGTRAATADGQRVIRIHQLPSGEVVDELAWHPATVSVLGFGAGNTLVSGDNDGTLAVWDLETSPP